MNVGMSSAKPYIKGRQEKHLFPSGLGGSEVMPAVSLVEVRLREGKSIGSEEGKVLGCGFYYTEFIISTI
jgi:hypothetical protein